jgi:hypothetical protein
VDAVSSRALSNQKILVNSRPTLGRDLVASLGPDRYEIHGGQDLESTDELNHAAPALLSERARVDNGIDSNMTF